MKKEGRLFFRTFVNVLIPLVWLALVIFLGPKLVKFFMPFVIGLIISVIVYPIVHFLEQKLKLGRKIGFFLIAAIIIAAVVVGMYFLISILVTQASGILVNFPEKWHDLKVWADHTFGNLPFIQNREGAGILDQIETWITANITSIGAPTMGFVSSIPAFIIGLVVAIFSSFLFVTERSRISDFLKDNLTASIWKVVKLSKDNTGKVIGGYIWAQFKIMMVVFVICFVGMLVLRIQGSFFLALLTAIMDFLPVFGAGVILWPMAFYMLIKGAYFQVIGILILNVLVMIFHQAAQPKMIGDSMDMNPLYTLILLFLGFKFWGIGGMIVAIPIGLIVREMYKSGIFNSFFVNFVLLTRLLRRFRGLDEKTGLMPGEEEFAREFAKSRRQEKADARREEKEAMRAEEEAARERYEASRTDADRMQEAAVRAMATSHTFGAYMVADIPKPRVKPEQNSDSEKMSMRGCSFSDSGNVVDSAEGNSESAPGANDPAGTVSEEE